jgi:hypothetical protein
VALRLVRRLRLGPRRVDVRPVAAVPIRQPHDLVEVQPPGHRQHHVSRPVTAREVLGHLVALEPGDRFDRPEHAHRQRVLSEVRLHQPLVQAVPGVVEVHRDLFEDDLLLRREVLDADGRAEQVREVLDRALGELGQDVGVVGGHLLGGERVVARADLVEDPVHVLPRVLVRPLEHHVLEEVRHPVDRRRLVARAGLHEEPGRERVRVGVDLGDDVQPILELCVMKRECHVVSSDLV